MVRRQGSRFGVVTNQSVRRSNVSASQDVNQYVVIKTMSKTPLCAKENKRIMADYHQQIQDGNLASNSEMSEKDPNGIMYSLNKHKRWELPEMLKENILDPENHAESKFQVTLSERHVRSTRDGEIIRSGDCIAVHQSKSDQQQRFPKRTYAFESDLAGAQKKGRRSKRRRKRQAEMDEEKAEDLEDALPEIHYEVCYPRPKNKYQSYGRMSKNNDVTVKSGKKSNKKSHIGLMDWQDEEDMDDYVDEAAFVAHDSMPLGHDESDYDPVTLGNVLVTLLIDAVCSKPEQGKRRRRHCSKASVSSQEDSDFETKEHIVVVDEEEIQRFQPQAEDEEQLQKLQKANDKILRRQAKRALKRQQQRQPEPESEPKKVEIPYEDPEKKIEKNVSVYSFKLDHLQREFGECYVEGNCRPRRFVINMKSAVEEYLISKGFEKIAQTLIESSHQMLLLFEPSGCVETILGDDQPPYQKVRIKLCGFPQEFLQKITCFIGPVTKSSSPCYACSDNKQSPEDFVIPTRFIPPEMLRSVQKELEEFEFPYKHNQFCVDHIWSVAEIVEFIKTALSDVEPECFYRKDGAIGRLARQHPVALETVQTVTRIEWESSTPRAVLQNEHQEVNEDTNTNATVEKPANCSICYDTLLKSITGFDASTLNACGHWFCNDCWTQHLRSRVKQGDINILCPEFDCDTPVDKVLLLAYLTQNEFRTQTIHHRNVTLSAKPDWTWCPNNACGRMVKTIAKSGSKVSPDGTVAINCDCGVLWCSSCKGEGHWPATCEQAAAYWKVIKKNGTVRFSLPPEVEAVEHVMVKRCPFCRNLFEKEYGCNYMLCVCNKEFCWDCLGDYNKHDYRKCLENQRKLKKVMLETIDTWKALTMPAIALQHRERRTRVAVMKRRKAAEILAKKAFLIQQDHKKPSVPQLAQIDDTCSIASSASTSSSIVSVASYKSLPLTWMPDDESSWQQLQELLDTAASAAKFCSEAEFCLEYLEVLVNDPNTELQSPVALYQLKDRLIFITDQLHMILHGELQVNANCAMGRVVVLVSAGKKCLKWIAANVPLVLAQDENDQE